MSNSSFNRRQFNQLTAAAFGGMMAGSLAGCGSDTDPKANVVVANADVHLCRGLNECKTKGADTKNGCRGQGTCATATQHGCGGQNECKGLGGCGEAVGENACKTKGGCHVPLMDDAWKKVRDRLETKWKSKKEEFAAAPAAVVEKNKARHLKSDFVAA